MLTLRGGSCDEAEKRCEIATGICSEFGFVRSETKTTAEGRRADTEAFRIELRFRDERQTQAIRALSDKVGTLMEVRERLALLKAGTRRA